MDKDIRTTSQSEFNPRLGDPDELASNINIKNNYLLHTYQFY